VNTKINKRNFISDDAPKYGRRVAWYAIVRIMKPKVIVETGIDKGLGSCVITAALMKNKEQGFDGKYYGTDINLKAGYLLKEPYSEFGRILYGDSLRSIKKFNKKIDLFINDSDHSKDYERKEFEAVEKWLVKKSILIGDNSHWSDVLMNYAKKTGRKFLFIGEQPLDHWCPPGGIGIAYKDVR
jgi:predicted O-methyltransferase YrrM